MNISPRLDNVIALKNVSKTFNQRRGATFTAVNNVTLSIERGQLVALLGKTGCGKSTIFNIIAGLMQPSSGEVLVDGLDPFRHFNAFSGKIAVVFQNDRLLPWRTAAENVEVGLEILGVAKEKRRDVARKWLVKLGLQGHEDDFPHALSGGMRQRVSIARAFATEANILLCDEPFSALDEMTADSLRREFSQLVRENGKTAVFITHSINEALKIGDRIIVLKRPAKIAFDSRVPHGISEGAASILRKEVLDALALPSA